MLKKVGCLIDQAYELNSRDKQSKPTLKIVAMQELCKQSY